jgi:N-acetylglucosamine-6-phosphate deacetylase
LRPCLFDIQVNGFGGIDFQNSDLSAGALRHACERLRDHHTHRILLTLITDSVGSMADKLSRIESMRRADPMLAATIVGYHLEGPYLSPEDGYRGAHPARFMKAPELPEFRRLQKAAGGAVRLVTLAPEWPGSARFIAALAKQGVVISLGHTNATGEQIDRAVRAGARMCTHLGNGCSMQLPRHDNIIQRLLARDELVASFIPDGIHLPPFVLQNLLRAKPKDRIVLTTDAIAAAAAPPGPVFVQQGSKSIRLVADRNGSVSLPGHPGYLFGSSLTLDRGVAQVSQWTEFSYETAWRWASLRPAEIFGLRLPKIRVPVAAVAS